ncbi:hypothetical protein [Endozoicomonas sp. ONNA1]|uniref:hypothetical protein n=1 Tax=Endozoicomonas sp. ONNA1 TaxID=2828740 RepID=UPI0021479CDA|nr:hypothetical protein [Endozoicomonas sp. ONNA1]
MSDAKSTSKGKNKRLILTHEPEFCTISFLRRRFSRTRSYYHGYPLLPCNHGTCDFRSGLYGQSQAENGTFQNGRRRSLQSGVDGGAHKESVLALISATLCYSLTLIGVMPVSAKARPQPTEIDHIRNTLTDVVDGLGQTRGEMHQRFDQQEKEHSLFKHEVKERFDLQEKEHSQFKHEVQERFDLQEKEHRQFKHEVKERFDCLEQKIDQQSSEFSEVKEMLQALLTRQ